jgi:hypothetical protein
LALSTLQRQLKRRRSDKSESKQVGRFVAGLDCSFHASELLENCSFSDRAGARITLSLIIFLSLPHLLFRPLPIQFGL